MKFITIVFLTLLPLSIIGQSYFEGKIRYAYEVNAKSKKIDLRKLQQSLGKGSTLLFKEGNFRHNYDGGLIEFDLYNRQENRYYMKNRAADTLYWYDCSTGGKLIKDLKVSTKEKKILGILCNKLSIQYPDHTKVEYYNSDSIRIDAQWFADFKRDEQYKIDSIQKSIFLYSELIYPALSIISRATNVQKETVSMDVFKIPANAILVKRE